MKDGFIRCGSVSPDVRIADCTFNANEIIKYVGYAADEDCSVLVFPELSLTGATCGELFQSQTLIDGSIRELERILMQTAEYKVLFVMGMPLRHKNKLYNCSAVCYKGEVLGFVPKKKADPIKGFAGWGNRETECVPTFDSIIGDILFADSEIENFTLAVRVGDDKSAPPCEAMIIANPCADHELVGRADYRRKLAEVRSAENICAYIVSECGFGESTQDHVYGGQRIICENGSCLEEAPALFGSGVIFADVDLQLLDHERRKDSSFETGQSGAEAECSFILEPCSLSLIRHYHTSPFIPECDELIPDRCCEILKMQATGLATRLKKIGCKTAVIGLSGGLDSTLALIVTVHAFDMLSLDRKGIVAVTMPCFGTTSRTKSNALCLAEAYGAQIMDINISAAVRQHFADIGQSEDCHDVVYENSQARERTQVIMDIANQKNGLVIGTGDISELALGWATYNGDHMSMYGVNADIPKTLVRHIVAYEADNVTNELARVLRDVLDTPVSPELLPPSEDGTIAQKTEDIVGPYELHDFFLYYMVRYGFSPAKIYRIACKTFNGKYDNEVIMKWLKTFVRRFFTQQFKRSCLPDGPKVGSVGLSPRGDWNMPSDASASMWLEELENL